MFNKSWKEINEIDYRSNTNYRKALLLELYAWSEVLNTKSQDLLHLLLNRGKIY